MQRVTGSLSLQDRDGVGRYSQTIGLRRNPKINLGLARKPALNPRMTTGVLLVDIGI